MSNALIETYTGIAFDLLDPKESDIDIIDIAHALSNTCRFAGHTKKFHSVAHHSVLVSDLLPNHLKLVGLLHDAPEAYIHDITTPFKNILSNYRDIEKRIWDVICKKFYILDYDEIPCEVKVVDYNVLLAEKRDMMQSKKYWKGLMPFEDIVPIGTITHLYPEDAEKLFLQRFKELVITSVQGDLF